jgi:hypothetical protein
MLDTHGSRRRDAPSGANALQDTATIGAGVPSLGEISEFLWGAAGALVGGGAVYGKMQQRIDAIEKGQESDRAESTLKRTELTTQLHELRIEMKAELTALRDEMREDNRELVRLLMERKT